MTQSLTIPLNNLRVLGVIVFTNPGGGKEVYVMRGLGRKGGKEKIGGRERAEGKEKNESTLYTASPCLHPDSVQFSIPQV